MISGKTSVDSLISVFKMGPRMKVRVMGFAKACWISVRKPAFTVYLPRPDTLYVTSH